MNKLKKPVTVSISKDLFDEYKKYCNIYGMLISKRIELLLKKDLENIKNIKIS